MSSKQGPRAAGMCTTASAVNRRHDKTNNRDNLTEAAT